MNGKKSIEINIFINISIILKYIIVLFVLILFSSNSAYAIRIGLLIETNSVTAATSVNGIIIDKESGREICAIDAMKSYKLRSRRNNSISIQIDGKKYDLDSSAVIIRPLTDGFVCVKDKWYRGDILVINRNKSLTVINELDIESYLLGVVPSEMPSSWHEEALKAQAIAARSYAIANLGKQSKYGFDLKDNTEDQAYGGASAETERTNNAVAKTYGIVVTQDKQVISAFYCASAGGKTLNSGAVWANDLPYLHSVPSFDKENGKNGHGLGMSQHGANNLANQGYNAYQIISYYYNNVKFGKLPLNKRF